MSPAPADSKPLRGYFHHKPLMKKAYEAFLAAPGETLSSGELIGVLYGEAVRSPRMRASTNQNVVKLLSRMRLILEEQTGLLGWLPQVSLGSRRNKITAWCLRAPERTPNVGQA